MANAGRTRLAQLRKRLAIPRGLYLSAVRRQEDRAWAKWTDPTPLNEMIPLFKAARDALGTKSETQQTMTPHEPAAALFDTDKDIQRDDAIIDAFLADNPYEKRRPMARGTTHDELFEYWKSTDKGRRQVEHYEKMMEDRIKRLVAEYKSDSIQAE